MYIVPLFQLFKTAWSFSKIKRRGKKLPNSLQWPTRPYRTRRQPISLPTFLPLCSELIYSGYRKHTRLFPAYVNLCMGSVHLNSLLPIHHVAHFSSSFTSHLYSITCLEKTFCPSYLTWPSFYLWAQFHFPTFYNQQLLYFL